VRNADYLFILNAALTKESHPCVTEKAFGDVPYALIRSTQLKRKNQKTQSLFNNRQSENLFEHPKSHLGFYSPQSKMAIPRPITNFTIRGHQRGDPIINALYAHIQVSYTFRAAYKSL